MIPTLTGLSLTNIPSLIALIVSSIFVQPAAALACGVLARIGLINPLLAFAIIFATDLIMDCVWYFLGHHSGDKAWGFVTRILGVTEGSIRHVTNAYHAHPAKIIITAKLLGGLGVMPAILFTAGVAHMNFRKYMLLNASGEAVWTTILMGVGYFFSHWYLAIGDAIGQASIVAGFVVLAGVLIWGVRLVRQRVIDDTEDTDA